MKQKFFLAAALIFSLLVLQAQPKNGYYDAAEGKSAEALRTSLYSIIKNHVNVGYDGLWNVYYDSDVKEDGTVWDMYSDIPGGKPPYVYYPGEDQCGNYSGEGSCYNREHSMPKSWFKEASPMYSDAFHIYPTDGYVNNRRGNYPFGEVGSVEWTSKNGSKLGTCSYPGYTGKVFEPIDEYKGDFARTYFYMSTCYKDKRLDYDNGAIMFSGSDMKPWALNMLLEWHRQDPVSQKEIDRNNAVEKHQHNRNPYIDYPELAEHVWGTLKDVPFTLDGTGEYFHALPATNVTATGFTANWTVSEGATGYTLDVYTIQTTGDEASEVLLESDFMSGLPAGWTKGNGYSANEADGYRLASGSQSGSVSTMLNLEGRVATLTVNAKQYKNDNGAELSLQVNGKQDTVWSTTGSYVDYTAELSSDASTIELSAKSGKRVYLSSVRVETLGSKPEQVPVDGYPLQVGNVLSHDVTGLLVGTTYYYTVTPVGNGVPASDAVEVFTAIQMGLESADDGQVLWHVSGNELSVSGLVSSAVQLFSFTGVPVYSASDLSGELRVTLPGQGVYLLRVDGRTYKIMND